VAKKVITDIPADPINIPLSVNPQTGEITEAKK